MNLLRGLLLCQRLVWNDVQRKTRPWLLKLHFIRCTQDLHRRHYHQSKAFIQAGQFHFSVPWNAARHYCKVKTLQERKVMPGNNYEKVICTQLCIPCSLVFDLSSFSMVFFFSHGKKTLWKDSQSLFAQFILKQKLLNSCFPSFLAILFFLWWSVECQLFHS